MTGEIAATREGKILALRSHVLADHGAFNGTAAPRKFPGGFFGVFTGSYDLEAAYCSMTAVHTNKAPGGVAYACSFRIAEAVYLVERTVDLLARELEMDPVELRQRNFIRPDQFPYTSRTGWVYDSGDYAAALHEALRIARYDELRAEYDVRRRLLADILTSAGLDPLPIGGSYFLTADVSRFGFPTDVDFCRWLVREHRVAAVPPSAFYLDPSTAPLQARFCFAKSEATLQEAGKRLSRLR